jgi:hypothetical protein
MYLGNLKPSMKKQDLEASFDDVYIENVDPRLSQIKQAQEMIDTLAQKHQLLSSSSRQRSKSLVVPQNVNENNKRPATTDESNPNATKIVQNKRVCKPPTKHPSALLENLPPYEAILTPPVSSASVTSTLSNTSITKQQSTTNLPQLDSTAVLAKKEKLAKVTFFFVDLNLF